MSHCRLSRRLDVGMPLVQFANPLMAVGPRAAPALKGQPSSHRLLSGTEAGDRLPLVPPVPPGGTLPGPGTRRARGRPPFLLEEGRGPLRGARPALWNRTD